MNESKHDDFRGNLLSMEFSCVLHNSHNRQHPLRWAQCPLNVFIVCFVCQIIFLTCRPLEFAFANTPTHYWGFLWLLLFNLEGEEEEWSWRCSSHLPLMTLLSLCIRCTLVVNNTEKKWHCRHSSGYISGITNTWT